jgi:hypothetical protein
VRIPSTLRVENNLARLVASADLQLRGTYDRPLLFGRAEVDRGEVTFEGRRYLVTRGNIDFTNPTKIEPFLDVEAETRVRVPGQTYQVTVRALGTVDRLQPELSSDPPLPAADVLALLFSDVRRTGGPGDVEVRSLQPANRSDLEYGLIRTRATQLIAGPVSSEVGRIVEQTSGGVNLAERRGATAATLIKQHDTVERGIEEPAMIRIDAAAGTAVNDDQGRPEPVAHSGPPDPAARYGHIPFGCGPRPGAAP